MEYHFLKELLIVFALGGLVVYALRSIKLPAIAGLLITGAAIGPHGLSLVEDAGRVELLAEIGVVLLLFMIGLESSLGRLLEMWRTLLFGGGGQLVLCISLVALCTWRQGHGLGVSCRRSWRGSCARAAASSFSPSCSCSVWVPRI